ncbi:hypothetical protein MTO96_000724 [Rhipicephalus appendiculatus]
MDSTNHMKEGRSVSASGDCATPVGAGNRTLGSIGPVARSTPLSASDGQSVALRGGATIVAAEQTTSPPRKKKPAQLGQLLPRQQQSGCSPDISTLSRVFKEGLPTACVRGDFVIRKSRAVLALTAFIIAVDCAHMAVRDKGLDIFLTPWAGHAAVDGGVVQSPSLSVEGRGVPRSRTQLLLAAIAGVNTRRPGFASKERRVALRSRPRCEEEGG